MVDKTEYEARLKEIEALYKETKEMEEKLFAATRQHAKAAGDELDETLGRKPKRSIPDARFDASVEAWPTKWSAWSRSANRSSPRRLQTSRHAWRAWSTG